MSDDQEIDPRSPRANPDLHGHDEAEKRLLEAWTSGRMHHAWLITGPRGIGKATLAYRMARFVLSGGGEGGGGLFGDGPDNLYLSPENGTFRRIVSGGHPDFAHLEVGMMNPQTKKVAQNDIPVALARKTVEFVRLTPAESDWRVILVDAADDLNRNAANALLKALEEPPDRALFLLVSHAPGRLLPTIRSRCRQLVLQPLPDETVIRLLQERYEGMDQNELTALALLAEGSIGKAVRLSEAGGIDLYCGLMKLMGSAERMDLSMVSAFADQVSRKGQEVQFAAFRELLDWWFKRFLRAKAQSMLPAEIVSGDNDVHGRLSSLGDLALWLEVWEKMTGLLSRTESPANLDKRHVLVSAFSSLEAALARR